PLEAAQRELAEEIGKAAERWERITSYVSSAGMSDEVVHVFHATGLSDRDADADENERIEIVRWPLDDLDGAIATAREEAQRLAAAGGLTLGPLVSVSEPEPSPFFGGPVGSAYGAEGTFGPGRFCGQIRTPIRRRDARGVLRNTGRVRTRFGCRVPGEVAQTVSATFAVS